MNRDDVLFFLSGSEEEQISRFSPDVIIPLSIPQDSDSDDENRFADGEDTDFAPSSIVGVTESMPLQLLYSAYMQGVFPWFSEDDDEPVVWWCPSPRFVLLSENFHIPKSVKKLLKKKPFTYTFDECFETVIHECRAAERKGQDGTWIGEKIIRAYTALHRVGFAHSVGRAILRADFTACCSAVCFAANRCSPSNPTRRNAPLWSSQKRFFLSAER